MGTNNKERTTYFDALRIIAILCVIYNHTNEKGYYLYAFPSSKLFNIFYIAVAAFIAIGVPVFFMVSGALLLPREESIKDLYKKRVSRIAAVTIIFSVIMLAYRIHGGRMEPDAGAFLQKITGDQITASYWFLYSYLAYLICLPFIRAMAKSLRDIDYIYLLILHVVIEGVIPVLLYFTEIEALNSFFFIPFFDRIVIFPLMGHYFGNIVKKEDLNRKTAALLILASVISIAVIVVMTKLRDLPYEEFTRFDKGLFTCSLTTVVTITVFYTVRLLSTKIILPNFVLSATKHLGKATFGVYLLDPIIRETLEPYVNPMAEKIGAFPACVVWVLEVYLVGSAITILLRLIPGIKKLL